MDIEKTTKILIVTNSISGGGAEVAMGNLAVNLRDLGINCTLCAINEDGKAFTGSENIVVIGRKWKSGLLATIHSIVKFKKFLSGGNFNLIIINCELVELFLAITSPRHIKLIAVEHTSNPWIGRRALGVLIRFALKLKGAIWVTVSSDLKSIWPTQDKPIHILNPSSAFPKNPTLNICDLVFVGRMNKYKHPEIVAESAHVLGLSVHFYGDGPLMQVLASSYQNDKCKFFGYTQEPWRQISSDSILVVPSEFEGDGLNVVEGILHGNPILLADNADLRRFGLPNVHYFENSEQLNSKILDAINFGSEKYRCSPEYTEKLARARDPKAIAVSWKNLIQDQLIR